MDNTTQTKPAHQTLAEVEKMLRPSRKFVLIDRHDGNEEIEFEIEEGQDPAEIALEILGWDLFSRKNEEEESTCICDECNGSGLISLITGKMAQKEEDMKRVIACPKCLGSGIL